MHLAALTSLRFVAAFAILIFHLLPALGVGDAYPVLALGVSFFFVLSGFILTFAYADRSRSLGEFALHRVARIWPVHVATAALALAVFGTWPGADVAAANLLLLHAWVPLKAYVFSLNGVSWSISAEMAFYAAFPLLLSLRRYGWWLLGMLAVTLVAVVLSDTGAIRISNPDPWGYSAHTFIAQGPTIRLFEFAIGVGAGRLYLSGVFRNASVRWATVAQIAAVFGVLAFAWSSGEILQAYRRTEWRALATWYNQSGGFLAFAVLIYAFALPQGRLARCMSGSIAVRLGEISFALYMVHAPVLELLRRVGPAEVIGAAPAAALGVGACVAAAYLVWAVIEVPARRLILRSLAPRKAAQAAHPG